jgi:glutathione synthase
MPEIAFLLGNTDQAHNDNHERLPAAFRAAGWHVTTLPHDAVRMRQGRVRLDHHDPQRFQLIWLVGFGPAASFLDRMQLLRLLDQHRLVNAVEPLIHLHGKSAWVSRMPETHVSNDPGFLGDIVDGGGDWVAKPTAGSFGQDVWRLSPGASGRQLLTRLIGETGRYCMLQRFVPGIDAGEKRTLVAGGRLIGTYLRRPGTSAEPDFRANLAAGGGAEAASLTDAEQRLVQEIVMELDAAGVGFAAVDTVYPYLMEVNLANPGGLGTLETLYGRDLAAAVVDALVTRRARAVGAQ